MGSVAIGLLLTSASSCCLQAGFDRASMVAELDALSSIGIPEAHPNVANLLERCESRFGVTHAFLEYCTGGTLRRFLQARRPDVLPNSPPHNALSLRPILPPSPFSLHLPPIHLYK